MAPAVAVSNPRPPAATRRGHEEDEERAHPVVAEALPHLGEEQRGETARMAEEAGVDCASVAATRGTARVAMGTA